MLLIPEGRDITAKKQLEKQFYRAQRLESLGTLASGIAHDLNNIFTPILSIAQLLPFKLSGLEEETRELLNLLQTSARRGAAIVKQVLLFSRGVEGKHRFLPIGHLLREVKDFIEQTFPKSIVVASDIPKDLWFVRGDSTQLHQMLINLCVNARDAMPDGGTLSLSVANQFLDEQYARMNLEAKVGHYIVLTVADTGVGIPVAIQEQIFDPFFTTKEVGQGTGLGLATALGIIKSHDGFLRLKSEEGSGSQFQVYLPAVENTMTKKTVPVLEQQFPTGQGELILVVDDEALIREVIKESLETHNYQVITASDGIDAIALYAQYQEEISVAIVDLIMPEMDGLTAMRALQKINPAVKCIVASGSASQDKIDAAAQMGSQAFLAKPYRTHLGSRSKNRIRRKCPIRVV